MKGEFRDRNDARRGYLAFNEATKRLTFRGRAGEEAIAIMVANIFSSEINRPLRRDSHGFAQMKHFVGGFIRAERGHDQGLLRTIAAQCGRRVRLADYLAGFIDAETNR